MNELSSNSPAQKVWIFAGESSGDLYGARLTEALKAKQPDLVIQGMGGKAMAEAGVDILVDSTDLGIVGFVEVIKHLPMFKRIFRELVARAEQEQPDAVILIDYPGFNLRFAKEMHERKIKVIYYISPQVWAWGKKRIPEIARMVSHMMVIFPFEDNVYSEYKLPTTFVGHPLLEILERGDDAARDPNCVLLLPGSRRSEIDRLLAPILDAAVELHKDHPDLKFVLPLPRENLSVLVKEKIASRAAWRDCPIQVTFGDTEDWMKKGIAGIAASGTVTVQSAILGLPLIVVYKMNPFSYMIGKMLIDVPYITMVNLVCEEKVFEEFLQGDVNGKELSKALEKILPGGSRREDVMRGIDKCISRLGAGKEASVRAAEIVLNEISTGASDG